MIGRISQHKTRWVPLEATGSNDSPQKVNVRHAVVGMRGNRKPLAQRGLQRYLIKWKRGRENKLAQGTSGDKSTVVYSRLEALLA
jgi:hypothetical protein